MYSFSQRLLSDYHCCLLLWFEHELSPRGSCFESLAPNTGGSSSWEATGSSEPWANQWIYLQMDSNFILLIEHGTMMETGRRK